MPSIERTSEQNRQAVTFRSSKTAVQFDPVSVQLRSTGRNRVSRQLTNSRILVSSITAQGTLWRLIGTGSARALAIRSIGARQALPFVRHLIKRGPSLVVKRTTTFRYGPPGLTESTSTNGSVEKDEAPVTMVRVTHWSKLGGAVQVTRTSLGGPVETTPTASKEPVTGSRAKFENLVRFLVSNAAIWVTANGPACTVCAQASSASCEHQKCECSAKHYHATEVWLHRVLPLGRGWSRLTAEGRAEGRASRALCKTGKVGPARSTAGSGHWPLHKSRCTLVAPNASPWQPQRMRPRMKRQTLP